MKWEGEEVPIDFVEGHNSFKKCYQTLLLVCLTKFGNYKVWLDAEPFLGLPFSSKLKGFFLLSQRFKLTCEKEMHARSRIVLS